MRGTPAIDVNETLEEHKARTIPTEAEARADRAKREADDAAMRRTMLERNQHDRIFGTALDAECPTEEKEMVALALQFKKATGKPHPIFGKVNMRRHSHAQSVDHVAGLLRRGQNIEALLNNCWINIGLDPESLRAAAEAKVAKRKQTGDA